MRLLFWSSRISFSNASKRILRKASLSEELTIHSLRHTYAVIMLEAGADINLYKSSSGMAVCKLHQMCMLIFPRS
ncbi:tyrosine-type recombinase/integrase [Paenibacillus sp. RRE4]|uniref:tyrosine-type recombinase/integrase n=1 Tax=Paenibacillus sp. RRE4 TaxID=2962587 RepID=UPI0037C7DAD6